MLLAGIKQTNKKIKVKMGLRKYKLSWGCSSVIECSPNILKALISSHHPQHLNKKQTKKSKKA
jgi:hypothetical protein